MLVSQDTGIFLMRYIQGENRSQSALFPLSLDELIPDDHLVRVIEAYIALLDFEHLGFDKARPKATGRPSYDPADLLKSEQSIAVLLDQHEPDLVHVSCQQDARGIGAGGVLDSQQVSHRVHLNFIHIGFNLAADDLADPAFIPRYANRVA